ncbi:single-stranded DNA-binding protein [Ornithinimicrobium tianjinense]|uniref:Single-stranded DNA-binding protein n=1 Tax=Ornithinimicrobium tianjinense TaxID=1195761 RepID=A0A917F3N6_9MICO|nr:single-stranded DNA-binding protein [Ornithinimicrobium tianjinense]GGF42094.1 hypothetical protein GCM10011366_07330 [Ornithinimicrobium tianjinense]
MVETRMTIAGNLTRDPQLRFGRNSGRPFAVLSVAVNNRRQDKESGQWVTTGTTYFDVLCMREKGANALLTFKKGDPVIAHGKLRLQPWSNEQGSGVNVTIDADAVGPDVSFGTAPFTRGRPGYGLDPVDDYEPSGDAELGHLERLADANGEVDDDAAALILARSEQDTDEEDQVAA